MSVSHHLHEAEANILEGRMWLSTSIYMGICMITSPYFGMQQNKSVEQFCNVHELSTLNLEFH